MRAPKTVFSLVKGFNLIYKIYPKKVKLVKRIELIGIESKSRLALVNSDPVINLTWKGEIISLGRGLF